MHAHTRFLWYGTLFRLLGSTVAVAGVSGCRARPAIASAASADSSVDSTGADAAPRVDSGAGPDARVREPSLERSARTVPLVPATASTPVPPPRAVGADYPPFKKTSLGLDVLTQLVDAAPQLAPVGGALAMFDPGDNPYVRRSKADHEGYVITPLPVLWSPAQGVQILVVTGRGKEGSFVAAWWPLPDGQYRLASTFVMLGEIAPVALAYRPPDRALEWTTCWRCKGEGGHVVMNDDGTVVIVQD